MQKSLENIGGRLRIVLPEGAIPDSVYEFTLDGVERVLELNIPEDARAGDAIYLELGQEEEACTKDDDDSNTRDEQISDEGGKAWWADRFEWGNIPPAMT